MTRPLISIVTPCYNEAENVDAHFKAVCEAIAPFRERYTFEHIYTDNCSEDATFELLSALAAKNPGVKVLRFSRNIGADRAIYFGLQHARGDAVIVIQGDLQDPPEVLPEFIKGWEEGHDVVYGSIRQREEPFLLRTFRNIYYRIVTRLSDIPVPRNAGEFRLLSRRALDALLQYGENDLYIRGAVAQIGFPQKPIPYARRARAAGQSSVNFVYLVGYAINGVLSTSVVLIRLVTLAGLATSLIGFLLTGYIVLGKWIFPGQQPHGFTTLASLITFFAGCQLLAMGIIGEYIRKIYIQSLQRPRGFVKDRINFDEKKPE